MSSRLSATIDETQVKYRLGLISDTHMPERWHTLPPGLSTAFSGVDLILHAGDVGELWVLNQLSAIAPVVAVHGNDEPPDTPNQLPHKQILTVAGQRILLWHGHYPDRVDELESRRSTAMRPKLERIARHGRQVGADVVHFGHWYIPLLCEIEDVTLVNAGAIASGNFVLRQLIQTVAILTILTDGRFHLKHIDLADLQPHYPPHVIDTDFTTAARPYAGSILAPDIQAEVSTIRDNPILYQILRQLAPRRWWADRDKISRAGFISELERMSPQTLEVAEVLAVFN